MQDASGTHWVDTSSTLISLLVYFGPWVLLGFFLLAGLWVVFMLRELLRVAGQIHEVLTRIAANSRGIEQKP